MNNIFNFKYYDRNKQFQYKVKWHNFNRDDNWYNIDKNEFNIVIDVIINFHRQCLRKSKLINNIEIISTIDFSQESNEVSKAFL